MRRPIYDMVFACTIGKRGIGLNGKLPWRISKDMKFFKDLTTKG
jgi:dihydrofolate reductase